MFLTDPALRRIAGCTGDVWPEQVWRHHTTDPDVLGELARLLHRTTSEYLESFNRLERLLTQVHQHAGTAIEQLRQRAVPGPQGHLRVLVLDLREQQEIHHVLDHMLLDTYRAWREHRPAQALTLRHLLLRPGDPSFGVATLQQTDAHTWLVTADAQAAAAFDIPYPQRVVGEIRATGSGWQPIAHTNPQHPTTQPHMTYPLPVHLDQTVACRMLLRWWQLRHSAAWRSRSPEQLTETELAALTENEPNP